MSQSLRSNESRNFKRKRTAHACEECRSRKSRCDGGRPICDKCSEMGFLCRYNQPKKSSKSSISAMQLSSDNLTAWLAGRLDNMERLLEKLVSKNDAGMPPYPPNPPPDTLSMQATLSNDHVDGMGCLTFADEDEAGHFGTLEPCIVQALLTGNQILVRPNLQCYFPSTYHNGRQRATASQCSTVVLGKCRTDLTIRMAISEYCSRETSNSHAEYHHKFIEISFI